MPTEKIPGLDFLKFLAALMITNSHFIPLYKDHNISYATFGVHGNALFFFVSGFLLRNTFRNNNTSYTSHINYFPAWFKGKIQRIWPTILVWPVLSNLIFQETINWKNFLLAGDFWFIRCILLSLAVIFFLLCYAKEYLRLALIASVLLTAVLVLLSNKVSVSIYHDSVFHYFCYFSTMLFGLIVGINESKYANTFFKKDILLLILSFSMYFIFMYVGKGRDNYFYYVQLFAIAPLLMFLYYVYKICSYDWCHRLYKTRLWYIVKIISTLTLEIYLVQFDIISDKFNNFYPFNTIIVFSLILITAYVLRVCTNFFIQTICEPAWDWRKMIKL